MADRIGVNNNHKRALLANINRTDRGEKGDVRPRTHQRDDNLRHSAKPCFTPTQDSNNIGSVVGEPDEPPGT